MVVIGNLDTNIRADASEFVREVGDADSRLDTFIGRFSVGATAIAAFATAAAAGFTAIARQNAELRLGAGIAGLSIQQYEGLANSFRTFGLDADFAADIINDVSERLRDAQEGTETYAAAFDRIGINLDDFASQDRVTRLFTLARALETVDADAAQLSANELAGDQGQRLIAVIRDLGSEELEGRIRANIEAVDFTDEQSQRIQNAADRIGRIRDSVVDITLVSTSNLLERLGLGNEELAESERSLVGIRQHLLAIGVSGVRQPGTDFIDPAAGIAAAFEAEITVTGEAIREFDEQLAPLEITFNRVAGAALLAAETIESRTPADFRRERESTQELLDALDPDYIGRAAARLERIPNIIDNTTGALTVQYENQISLGDRLGQSITTALLSGVDGAEDLGDALVDAISRALLAAGVEGIIGSFGGQQFGGPIAATGRYIVGERGPEEVILPRGAEVVPSGGGTFIFNLDGDRRAEENLAMIEQRAIPQLNRIIDARIEYRQRRRA